VWDHDPKALGDVALARPIERLIEGQWHRDHIGDGRIKKYRDLLTKEQSDRVVEQTKGFIEYFGYDIYCHLPTGA
jgi:hypothetical protein